MAGREARRNDERLYFKFIVKYFEGLHKDLFEKAVDLFYEAKEKNPTVKDLTKTVQFMAGVTPELPIPRYYKNRQLKVYTQPQMVLQIPLFNPQELVASQTSLPNPQELVASQTSLPNPQELVASQTSLPNPQELVASQTSPPVPVRVPSSPVPVPSPPISQPFPLLTQSVYNDLLTEIQQDPELLKILNDFPHIDDDYETMNDLVWNDIYTHNDISPIEIEMDQY